MEMLLHPAVASRVPLSAFRPGNTKLFMSADTPFLLRNLKHKLLYPFVRRLQLWWQRRERDVNQRRIATAKRSVAAAQDKAALCSVHGVASVCTAIEVRRAPSLHSSQADQGALFFSGCFL
jgi:myosin heavy subunit